MLQRAVAKSGESTSAFIREAVAERASRILGAESRAQLADVIGVAHGGGSNTARVTGAEFRRRLRDKPAK